MTKSKAFFRGFKYELIALIVDTLVVGIAYITVTQLNVFLISLAMFILSTFIVIYFKTKEKNFYFYSFDKRDDEQDWVGRGKLKYISNEKCFEITNSHVGFILPKTSNWDDYIYELDFKITNKSFGFIVRAVNLSNYVMYQIFYNGLKPHLRINGQWIVSDVIKFENKLDHNKWQKLIVTCEKRDIRIIISQENVCIFDTHLYIPDNITIIQKELDKEGKEINEIRLDQNIDFDFGSVGIRNHGEERALLKNIFVERLYK